MVRERRNERRPGFNVGSASIIMIFSMLCLAIFAVLSLVTTNADLKLSRRAAKAVEDYYSAVYDAEEAVIKIDGLLKGEAGAPADRLAGMAGVSVEETAEGSVIRFTEPVDGRRELQVELLLQNESLSVTEWRLSQNSGWNPDTDIPVWTGG